MEKTRKLYNSYEDIVVRNKNIFLKDYEEVVKKVEESPAKYKGDPVEFLHQPMLLSKEDFNRFQSLTDQLIKILNKVINKYIEDEKFRSYFGFSPLLEKLILKDPGYSKNIPMGRFDIFYNLDGSFQFCELNADGSSGMVEARELQKIIGESHTFMVLKESYTLKDYEVFDSWAEALLTNYKEFSNNEEKPQIAIIDWFKGDPPSEFVEFKKTFEKFGCKTVIADPGDLVYKDKTLYYGNFRIDCVYRRAVTWEIIENQDKVQDFINAYLDGNVCVVGPLRSQVIHNKIIFAILHDPVKTPFLSKEEREFVKKHIPYTTEFNIENQDLVGFVINNKDELVLKPMDKYASKGVRIGLDFTKDEWERIIKEEAKEEYILQELCKIPKLPMAMVKDGDVKFVENNYLIGLFMYNEKLQGLYTRTGTKNIIGSVVECYTVPNFIIEEK